MVSYLKWYQINQPETALFHFFAAKALKPVRSPPGSAEMQPRPAQVRPAWFTVFMDVCITSVLRLFRMLSMRHVSYGGM